MKKPQKTGGGANEKFDISQRAHPGYYPGYSTLSQQGYWDEATRTAIVGRVTEAAPIRFFSPDEANILRAVVDRLLPQDDRVRDRRIPILPAIDARLYQNQLNGYRYEEMPPDQDAYRMALKAIDEMAQQSFGLHFSELMVLDQELILKSLHDGNPDPSHEIWDAMPVKRFWELLMDDCVTVYYAHPWAWDEIGFGGPAYPRGYMRLENGQREPWEVDEKRYEWSAPENSLSDLKLADLVKKSEPAAKPRNSR